MRLRGFPSDGEPGLSYLGKPTGSIVGTIPGPQGRKGDKGDKGDKGETGDLGPANELTIGTVTKGDAAAATIEGDAPSQVLNLVLPKGDKGEKGDKGDKGEQGDQGPQGAQGVQGDAGVSLDIEGHVATYAALASLPSPQYGQAWVNSADGLLYFYDPANGGFPAEGDGVPFRGEQGPEGPQGIQGQKGDTGAKGDKGDTGDQGPQGSTGATGAKGDKGDTGSTGAKGDKGDAGTPGYLPRTTSITSSATPSINVGSFDFLIITALAANITSITVSGTPVDGQRLMVRITDNGTARTITWGSSFQSGNATLLSTTVAGKTHHVGLIYDAVKAKWVCVAVDAAGY